MSADDVSSEPPVVPPENKDWTWVLTRPCDECGFDATAVAPRDVPALVGENASGWRRVLTGAGVRSRPSPLVWSPLEYACHVRDVFRIFDRRLHRMLDEDNPLFENWEQDETAVVDRYWAQDPATVAAELQVAAAQHLAAAFAAVSGDSWQRTGTRSDGAHFTVETFARYFIHDPVHHLHDVRRGGD
jgi:DinB superfamily